MKACTVFYAGLLYEESDEWICSINLPEGAYIHFRDKANATGWYLTQFNSCSPINICDVPKELRTYVLLNS